MKKDPNHWERYREIGFRIAYCRKYQKMTQEELAEKLNVSRQHIGAIEAPNVNRKISLDLIFDIADILNIEPKDAMYIGDTFSDYKSTKAAGMDFGLAGWGARDITDIEADYYLNEPKDILKILNL